MPDIKVFDFLNFLKNNSNESLTQLQDLPQYEDVLASVADIFSKLYQRTQEIRLLNVIDDNYDSSFQSDLNNNNGSVTSDFIFEMITEYLDTAHFKDTMAKMMRLWEEREVGGEIPDLASFIENHIIPAFRFFTTNAGDLHKSKGVKDLLLRLFEFYDKVGDPQRSFNDIVEHDSEDPRSFRLSRFSSVRIAAGEGIVTSNYSNIGAFDNVPISKYLETESNKLVIVGGFLFISEKDREEFFMVDAVDSVHKIGDRFFAIKQDSDLTIYRDPTTLYDANFEFVQLTPILTIPEVGFVPKVINITDVNGEYHQNVLYYVEFTEQDASPFDKKFNLKRVVANLDFDTVTNELVLERLGIGCSELYYGLEPPLIQEIASIDYIYLDFHGNTADPLYSFNVEDARVVYTFTFEYLYKVNETFKIDNFLAIARDGYYYDHINNNFNFTVLGREVDTIGANILQKYILSERILTPEFKSDIEEYVDRPVRTVFDFFIPERVTKDIEANFTNEGGWDASNINCDPPAVSPDHFDYYQVGTAGGTNLDGITNHKVGDTLIWNDNIKEWMKSNNIDELTDGGSTNYFIDHTLIALGLDEFDTPVKAPDNCITSLYEQAGGMFYYKLSDIEINVSSFANIINVDCNAIETFGPEPIIIFYYRDKDTKRLVLHSVKPRGFVKESDKVSITRLLNSFPNSASMPEPYYVEVTDKHLIAYTGDKTFPEFRTNAIVLENTTYNIPLGLRTNDMNVLYDATFRTNTRSRQPYFRATELDANGNEIPVEDEEVSAFNATTERYKPININTDSLHARMNLAYEGQDIDPANPVKDFLYAVSGEGTVNNKEVSRVSSADSLTLTIFGDPNTVNCDCNDLADAFVLADFETLKVDGFKTGDPLTTVITKVGSVNDIYSDNSEACRWQSELVQYNVDLGGTFGDTMVRQTFMLNLFDVFQYLTVVEGKEELKYNWNLVVITESYDAGTDTWSMFDIEYAYAPQNFQNECNPINTLYIENLAGDYDADPLDPFTNVYNIIGANVTNG